MQRNQRNILEAFESTDQFDEDLFLSVVESIRVDSNAEITFMLIGGIELTEMIRERGRCQSA